MTDSTSDEDRDDFILLERLSGRSARSIGNQLSLTVGEVNASLDRTLPKIDNAARLRHISLDLHRLDELLKTFFARATEKADAQAGLLVVKILERTAALLGLDQPQKLDVIQVQAQERPSSFDRVYEAIMRVARPGQPNGNGSDSGSWQRWRSVARGPRRPCCSRADVSKGGLPRFGVIGSVNSGFFRLLKLSINELLSGRLRRTPYASRPLFALQHD
jgi:hypothetical protein